jgi:PKD repeat protein
MRIFALALALLTVSSLWFGTFHGIAPTDEGPRLDLPGGTPWGGIEPIPFAASPAESKVISTIVKDVSEQRLRSDLNLLQGFGSRLYRAPGMYNCSDYLYELGMDLGLDAIYQNFTVDRGSLGIFTLSNVVWTMHGTNVSSDRKYYLYAHDDAVQHDDNDALLTNVPGADDDGSGTAAVMEAARVLSQYEFEDTIVFAFFNAEEIGLVGSAYWAQKMADDGENVLGGIDLDMIGFSRGVTEFDLDMIYNSASVSQASYLLSTNTRYGVGLSISPTETTGSIPSDIQSLYNKGFESVFMIEDDFNPYYHTTSDTVDKINFTLITKCTQLSTAALAGWARIAAPDAGIASLIVPENPLEGSGATIRTVVTNSGNVPLYNLSVVFRTDGEVFSRQTVNLTQGAIRQLSAEWIATIGRHNISVSIDPEGDVSEVEEGNNTAWASVETNDRPIAVLRMDRNPVLTDQTVILNASSSHDRVGAPIYYRFDLGDGNVSGWGAEGVIRYSYPANGIYTVSLSVRDSLGTVSDATTISLRVDNRPPTAEPWADTERCQTFDPISFGSNAYDPDGTVSYIWNFGDGSTSTEMDPAHYYTKSGIYSVTLNVTDDDGAMATGSLHIVVDDRVPKMTVNVSAYSGDISTVFIFEADCSDLDGEIVSINWEMGDGQTRSGPIVNHSFVRPGVYQIRVTAMDDDSFVTQKKLTVTIDDTVPSANGTADAVSIMSGDPVRFNGSGSRDLEGMVFFHWDFGDGSFSPQGSPIHNYNVPGRFVPKLRVFDGIGQSTECTLREITVGNRRPTAEFEVEGDMVPNSTIYLDGSGSADPEGPVTLSWELGDDRELQGSFVSFRYSAPGQYTINLTVTDRHGAAAYSQRTLTIIEKESPPEIEEDGGSSPMTAILIGTNLFWILLLIIIVAFFLVRSRRDQHDSEMTLE